MLSDIQPAIADFFLNWKAKERMERSPSFRIKAMNFSTCAILATGISFADLPLPGLSHPSPSFGRPRKVTRSTLQLLNKISFQ
jgi:hypothetical protein